MTARAAAIGLTLTALFGTNLAFARAPDGAFELGVGLAGELGLAVLDAPAPSALTLPRSSERVETHGMSGLALGGGLFIEGRLLSHLGLRIGAGYTRETISGELDVGAETVEVVLEHPALVVPILLQGFLPLGDVTAFVAAGPEWVIPTVPLARTEPERAFPVSATADRHVRLGFGGGVELRLPVSAVDLRVPLGVRATWHPGAGDALDERVRVLPSDVLIFTVTPRYGVRLTAGIGTYF